MIEYALMVWVFVAILGIAVAVRRLDRRLESSREDLTTVKVGVTSARVNQADTDRRVSRLERRSEEAAAIDVPLKDSGWLILVACVAGRDTVKIQRLRPNMGLQEYRSLVERLGYDCRHLVYVDSPDDSARQWLFRDFSPKG